ncbi:MAG: anti-sigma factor [Candidatus Rokubacteria bacterium]|nr:anti-sigma factor [Candidatus Rokubacteria bacterium]
MTCEELRACLDVYLDRELDVARALDAQDHLAFCMPCQWAYAKERELRALVKTRLPRVAVPPELRARIRSALDADARPAYRAAYRTLTARPLRWAALPVAAVLLVALAFGLRAPRGPSLPPVVTELVAQHQMYSRLDTPAEFVSASRDTVAGWFRGRVRFQVAVPDFSPSGIRLVGARLSSLSDREVAYLLYEKGRNLISLFAFAHRGFELPADGWIPVGESRFYVAEVKGAEVVLWTQGEQAYALVSPLNREALLECALTVWRLVAQARSGA